MSKLNQKKLFRYFQPAYVARGRDYFARNKVEFVNLKSDRGISAIVKGSRLYQINIDPILVLPEGWQVEGHCSCPILYNCKHVVAALLQAEKNGLELLEKRDLVDITPMDQRSQTEGGADFINEWVAALDSLVTAESQQIQNRPVRTQAAAQRDVLYLLIPPEKGGALGVEFVTAYQKQDGSYSQIKSFSPVSTLQGTPPSVVRPEDERLMRQLYLFSQGSLGAERTSLQGEGSAELFEKMIETGRCFWERVDGEALTLSEPRALRLEWRELINGEQQLQFKVTGVAEDECELLMLDRPCYRNAASGEVGALQSDYPQRLLNQLERLPPIPPQQVGQLQQQLSQRQHQIAIPALRKVTPPKIYKVEPQPILRLSMGIAEFEDEDEWYSWSTEPDLYPVLIPMADLFFDYDGMTAHAGDQVTVVWGVREGERVQIPRQMAAEERFRKQLSPSLVEVDEFCEHEGVAQIDEQYLQSLILSGGEEKVMDFCLDEIPKLRQQGWKIEFDEDWEWKLVEEPDHWYADLDESENDWFSLGLEVEIEGQRRSLLPMLTHFVSQLPKDITFVQLEQMSDDYKLLVELEDGQLLPIPLGKVRTILSTLIELYDERPLDQDGRIRFNRLEAVRMAELQAAEGAAHLRWMGGDRLLDLGHKLRDFEGIQSVEPSADFRAELRDYQQRGLSWLQFLREMRLGGILADDMGLGKTVQTLAHLQLEKQSGRMQRPTLVIAPTSLMVNWRSEAARFAPDLKVTVLHGPDRKEHFPEIEQSDLVLTTYPLVPRDREELLSHDYYQLVLDEAQVIKNPRAQVTQLVHQIKAEHRLCLSGTPMENHLGELWSLMHFLNPGLLGDEKQFRRLYRNPIEKRGDSHRQQLLQRRVAPFLLRRAKQEVLLELPEKTEIIRSVELEGTQSKLYESIRLAMHKKIKKEVERKGINRSHIVILDALLKLRQVCCDPRLLKLDAAKKVKKSAKLDMLMELLPEMLEEGRRVLLFSQFTSMLKLIEAELEKKKIDYVKLTGQTRDRATPVEQFQAGEVPLFLISLKAGGTGLNLTAADTVIHYDPWWNPAVENQATDRAHRIGQKSSVFVYKFITANTVEERILELQQRKSALVEGLYGDGKAKTGGQFSAEDLQMLFDPLGD